MEATTNVAMPKACAEIYNCIKETATLHNDIINALLVFYDEDQIDVACSEQTKNRIGHNIFEAINTIRQGLFDVMQEIITDDIYTLQLDNETKP